MPDPAEMLRGPRGGLPDPLPIPVLPARRAFSVSVRPPGSKSETNRAVILAALARGRSVIRNALTEADDAERALSAVRTLGAEATVSGSDITITGVGGRWRVPAEGTTVDLQNAGTATRFLAASAMLSPGPVTITGNERMRSRPIGQLAGALHDLGAVVQHHGSPGCPPLTVTPPAGGPPHAPTVSLGTPDSSQFVSALLMLGPWVPGGLTVRISGEVTSAPYLTMTLDLLARVGASVHSTEDLRVLRCGPGPAGLGLDGFEVEIEPDASGATYFWTAAAVSPGSVCTVEGLGERSIQGDTGYAALLERMGCGVSRSAESIGVTGPVSLSPILADLSGMPDTAMSLASACCFAPGTSILRGLRTLRVKETDRIEAMRAELSKLGVEVTVQGDDALTITPPAGGVAADSSPVVFDTYDDHRMAMSLSLIGLRRRGVSVRDPGCVAKTYPGFFADLSRIYPSSSAPT